MRSSQSRHRSARGTSTVEFAIVLPVLLLVLLGITEFSRAWMTLNVVTMAAREGARMAVVTPSPWSDAAAKTKIRDVLTPFLGAAQAQTVANGSTIVCAAPCAQNSQVTATVTLSFQTIVPGILPMLAGRTLTNTAVMRYE